MVVKTRMRILRGPGEATGVTERVRMSMTTGEAANIGGAAEETKQHSMKLATAVTGTAGQTDAAVRKKMKGMMMEAEAEKTGMLHGRERKGMMTEAGDIWTRMDMRRVRSMQGGNTGAPGGKEATGMMTGVTTGKACP